MRLQYRLKVSNLSKLFTALLIYSGIVFGAEANIEGKTHRVSRDIPNLSEVAMFLYGHPGMYKKIAQWNGLRPPYSLMVGQILKLEEAPMLSPDEGRAQLNDMRERIRAVAQAPKIYPYQKDGKTYPSFIVTSKTPSLSHVALFLYGRASEYSQIAKWNSLKSANHIYLGQRLILLKKPKTMTEQSVAKVTPTEPSADPIETSPVNPKPLDEPLVVSESIPEEATAAEELSSDPVVQASVEEADVIVYESTEEDAREIAALAQKPEVQEALSQEPPERGPKSATEYFEAGLKESKKGSTEKALGYFRKSRELNQNFLPSWFYELETLGGLARTQEAQIVAANLVSRRPELRSAPAVKKFLPTEN